MRAKARGARAPAVTACADYSFRQRFRVPAPQAFRWCIDFTPDDLADPHERGRRKVRWLSPRTVLLDDTFPAPQGRRVRKVKLVQIYPETRSWVSTHILGPNHYSQFRYRIVPDGPGASALLFDGRELRWAGPTLSAAGTRRLARRLQREDSRLWKRFAVEIERDFPRG
jgi:hypothetical protein